MTIDFSTIYGFCIGIEFADSEVKANVTDMLWGMSIDLGMFRITINKWKD